jgi:hypothetical protein
VGVEYYLARDDNKTLFDLGKVYEWIHEDGVWPCDRQTQYIEADPEGLKTRLVKASSGFNIDDLDKYCLTVAERVIRWSDGKPFVCVSEYDDHRLDNHQITDDRYVINENP